MWIGNRQNSRSQRVAIPAQGSSGACHWRPMVQYQAWLISDLDKGADASSASSLMTQGWEEWPIPQRDVQPFS